ncbi:putative GTP-binding protein 6, partial [Piliocolobus tephrosceles]|uniref:putative GTP-binding protein 6 n=1 Tax=Piliocolobus tephrosceles TaxID=591936 RepID=UPI001300F062
AAACGVEGWSWGVRVDCTQGYLPLPACCWELVPAPPPGRSASLGSDTKSFAALTAWPGPQDLIVHVRDVSHPEVELQKRSVLSTLHSLQLPARLLDSMVEVHNKVDLVPGYSPTEPSAVPVSALLGHGLRELKAELDAAVLKATGRQILTLRVRLAGAQLSWLYKEATVQDVDVIPEDGAADVTVIISDSAYGKFRKLFPG